jgi:hypothetical protein
MRRIDVAATGERFNLRESKGDNTMVRRINAAAIGTAAGILTAADAAAQTRLQDKFFPADESVTDVASAGNGGVATASANGGAVSLGNVNSGGNAGNAIGVGDTAGSVNVNGGSVANLTDIGVSANGGTAIADASGGDYNLAFVS